MVYPVSEQMIVCEPFDIPYITGLVCLESIFGWKDPQPFCLRLMTAITISCTFLRIRSKQRTPQQHVYDLMSRGIDWIPVSTIHLGRSVKLMTVRTWLSFTETGLSKLYPANNSRELGVQKTLQRMLDGRLKLLKPLQNFYQNIECMLEMKKVLSRTATITF